MLRSGPFSDEVVVGLLNTRFIPFYFDLGRGSPAGDDAAKPFVVEVKQELGGGSIPTPPVLIMTPDGELVHEISNYATEAQMINALRGVLADHPEFARPAPTEEQLSRLDRARIDHWLGDDTTATALLQGERTSEESLFLAQMARRSNKPQRALAALQELDPVADAADITLEQALLAWNRGDYTAMNTALSAYPADGTRTAEAMYYHGIAQYHLGDPTAARATWKNLVEQFGEHRWSYRADWAYSQTTDQGKAKPRQSFTTAGTKSLLGRHGYMGRQNPDLSPR